MSLGDKIKQLRTKNGMTQEDLAGKLFITRNAISKWETNKGFPNIDSLKELVNVFGVSLDYLLNEEELITLAIENKKNLELNKNLIYAFILFLSFALIGTLIPYYSFESDPTSGMAVFIIFLPLSYVLLGILSVLLTIKWPYVIVASALAITPIYVFFEVAIPTVRFGTWGIGYYILFLLVYFIISRIAISSSKRKNVLKLQKIFFFVSIGLTMVFVIHTTIDAIILFNCIGCSAPWYTAVVLNTVLYIIPLTILYSFYFYYKKEAKRQSKFNK